MERSTGSLFNFSNNIPFCNIANLENENYKEKPVMFTDQNSNNIWAIISQQSEILNNQGIMIRQLNDQLRNLQELVMSMKTEIKNYRSSYFNKNYTVPKNKFPKKYS